MTNLINLQEYRTEMETNKSLAVKIMVSCVDPTKVDAADLPNILKGIFKGVCALKEEEAVIPKENTPRFLSKQEIADTIHDDYLVCLEDGVKMKMIKRHLKTNYQITFEEYKEKWGLPYNYPSVCPKYSKRRSDLAKDMGLGKNFGTRKQYKPGDIIDIEDLPPINLIKNKTKPIQPINDPLDL